MDARRRQSAQSGFTLIEVLMAATVLSFAVIAIAQMLVAGQMSTYEALHHRRGQSLAEAMIEEILALPYADPDGASTPGPEGGEATRADFDNSDDFDGYSEAAGAVTDSAGDAYPSQFNLFSRAVAITETDITVTGFSADVPGIEVQVTVTDSRGQTWRVVRFIAEPSP